MHALSTASTLLGLTLLATGCAASTAPAAGVPIARRVSTTDPALDELARVEPALGRRALLVVYPRTACTGSTRTVLMDADGHFLGAVAPGEASLLDVPDRRDAIVAVSVVDVLASAGTSFIVDTVTTPAAPSGLLLRPLRTSARQCSKAGFYADASVATKAELEALLGETEIQWVLPQLGEGQAWLDAHKKRLDQILVDVKTTRLGAK